MGEAGKLRNTLEIAHRTPLWTPLPRPVRFVERALQKNWFAIHFCTESFADTRHA
jgi:hypothetical protein